MAIFNQYRGYEILKEHDGYSVMSNGRFIVSCACLEGAKFWVDLKLGLLQKRFA